MVKLRIQANVPGFMEDDAIIRDFVGKGLNDRMLYEHLVQQTASHSIAKYVDKRLKELKEALGEEGLWNRHLQLKGTKK